MSLMVAVISRESGVVASDGRRFDSAEVNFETGVVVRPAAIATDHFDKTFALEGGLVIGAACGLLEFSGQTVASHLTSIAEACLQGCGFSELMEELAVGMSGRLRGVDEAEVAVKARVLDIIAVGRNKIKRGNITIASMRVTATDQTVNQHQRYCYAGDDQAVHAANLVLARDYAGNRGTKALTQIAERAIRAGIAASGAYQYGGGQICGGDPFLRTLAPNVH